MNWEETNEPPSSSLEPIKRGIESSAFSTGSDELQGSESSRLISCSVAIRHCFLKVRFDIFPSEEESSTMVQQTGRKIFVKGFRSDFSRGGFIVYVMVWPRSSNSRDWVNEFSLSRIQSASCELPTLWGENNGRR